MKAQKPYIKVGRIKLSIAKKAKIKCADIVIDEAHIAHINNYHTNELTKLGMTALDYVKFIVDNYTSMYNNTQSILLAVKHADCVADTCCIQLHFINGWWEIHTAQPRKRIVGKLIYEKSSHKATLKMSKS